jgi:hypothetical protein
VHAHLYVSNTMQSASLWLRRFLVWKAFFASLLAYVCAVSAYDGYLVLRSGDEIRDFEKNPIGLLLINWNGGDPALFLGAKAIGTILVVVAMKALNRRSERLALPVTLALAFFQSALLVFLESH